MNEQWQIVDLSDDHVLEVTTSARKALRAQARWNKAWVWSHGPQTTIRRVNGEQL